jgi:branched-chain amino acid transport system substrate-binding protein
MTSVKKTLIAAAAALLATTAFADVNIGVTLSLSGPASGLGIPVGNQFKLFPKEIAGEKINLIVLDDASDPGKGVSNARRFVTDDKVDILFGGSITVVSAAIAPVALDSKTPQLSIAPVGVPPAQEPWIFRLPQGFTVMAHPIVEHMKAQGVKTLGFLGYTDAYGELWLKEITKQAEDAGIKVVATERFARTDTSATPQALKLVSANPDAMLVVASGSGAAMPHKALIERNRKQLSHNVPSTIKIGPDSRGRNVGVGGGNIGGHRFAIKQGRLIFGAKYGIAAKMFDRGSVCHIAAIHFQGLGSGPDPWRQR